jgi:hypothetical protein
MSRDFAIVRRQPSAPGLLIGALQLMLGLTWAAYVLFLPQLVVSAGLPRSLVPWLLVVDQLVFALCDPWAGAAGDRAAAGARRFGPVIAVVAAGSAIALIVLPMVAGEWPVPVLGALLLVWAIGTAALRAPLCALLSSHAPGSAGPNAAVLAGGLALASAGAGLLVPAIRDVSPVLAFAFVGAGTAAVALLAVPLERWLLAHAASGPTAPAPRTATPAPAPAPARSGLAGPGAPSPGSAAAWRGAVGLYAGAALLALGLQLHVFVVAPAVFGKEVPAIVPALFWIGSALACGLAILMQGRWPMHRLSVVSAAGGAVLLAGFGLADSLPVRAALHGLAGLAWGLALSSVTARVFEFGRLTRSPGLAAGLLFSLLALASLMRLALGALGVWAGIGPLQVLWMALGLWAVAAAKLRSPAP